MVDVFKVAARLTGTGSSGLAVPITGLDTNALAGAVVGFLLAPRDLGGSLTMA